MSTAGLLACPRGLAWLGGSYDAVYTPEPGASLGGLVAMFALAGVSRRRPLGGAPPNPVPRRA